MRPKVVAIVQARVGSTRLPGKVFKPLDGEAMLTRCVRRVERAKTLDGVLVATTVSEGDNAIVDFCEKQGWLCFRGSEQDVLDRFYQASLKYELDVVVRITSDCPFIDPEVIDRVVSKFLSLYPNIDYGSNLLPRTYPRGLDTEVVNSKTLESEWRASTNWREHVTLNIRKNYKLYRTCNVTNEVDYSYMRWCIDVAEDLEFAQRIFSHFKGDKFRLEDVVKLLGIHPEWVIKDTQVDPK